MDAVIADFEAVTRSQMRLALQTQLAREGIELLPKDFEDAVDKMVADSKRINVAQAAIDGLQLLEAANLESCARPAGVPKPPRSRYSGRS